MPAAAVLDRLRAETRYHQCVADADRVAFVESKPGIDGYRDYLIRAHGFELPLESALSAAPGLRELIDIDLRANARIIARELIALGFPPQDLLNIAHCRIAPMQSLAEACGWLYVAWRNRSAHEMLRILAARRHADAASWKASFEDHTTPGEWTQLGHVLDLVGAGDRDREILDAAIAAYDCQHFWYQAGAPSGSALVTAAREAEQRLRRTEKMRSLPRRPSEPD